MIEVREDYCKIIEDEGNGWIQQFIVWCAACIEIRIKRKDCLRGDSMNLALNKLSLGRKQILSCSWDIWALVTYGPWANQVYTWSYGKESFLAFLFLTQWREGILICSLPSLMTSWGNDVIYNMGIKCRKNKKSSCQSDSTKLKQRQKNCAVAVAQELRKIGSQI
jgi:hypothetical protein